MLNNSFLSRTTTTIVFIDSSISDYQTLQTGVVDGVETVILSPNQDGIKEISEFLAQYPQITSIHIVSHGSPGCLYLGNSQLNLDNISKYAELLQHWQSENILLYGCNVAAGDAGEEFIHKLHEITNATISASATKTGNAALGGNWELETTLGKITSNQAFTVAAKANYAGVFGAAPVITTTNTALAYIENGTTAIDSAIIVSDVDSVNLASATVSITSGFVSSQDILSFTNQNGITGSYNSTTGVLSLTGAATVANYQTALRSITYTNSSDNPNTTTRTIGFSVNDGAATSNFPTRNVTITAVNDAPVITTTNAALSYIQNGITAIDSTIIISDVDSSNLVSASVSITSGFVSNQDILSFTNQNGITGSYNSTTGVLSLTGTATVANYQTALRSITYTNTSNNLTTITRTIGFSVNDGAGTTTTTRVSTAADGSQGNNSSETPAISADGRYVVFLSYADNLVSGDTNGTADVFVKDLTTNSITRVSTAADGSEGNNSSETPAISADGRYVVFLSYADNLVSDDTNGAADVFVKDLTTNSITRVSTAADGSEGNNSSETPAISADGRYVVFLSYADNLVSDDTNGARDVFVKDLTTNSITRVSTAADGSEGNNSSGNAAISANGRYVVFWSFADNLVSDDTNGARDVFVKDLTTNSITRVSTAADGSQANDYSANPGISADGRYVVFLSYAENLVSDDTNGTGDVFVKDLTTNSITRVSTTADGSGGNNSSEAPAISADGHYVVFNSSADNLVSGDINGVPDVFVKNLITNSITRVSTAADGSGGNSDSGNPAISADGRSVVFLSNADNLVNGDTNGSPDVFLFTPRVINGSVNIVVNLAIEANGNTTFLQDAANKYFAQVGTATPIAIKNGGQQIFQDIYPGWQTLAAETVNGDNQVLWKNVAENYLHLWHLDNNWNWVSSEGNWGLNSAEALGKETVFGVDANGDGVIGNSYTAIESAGNTKLIKDPTNKYFTQVGTNTPTAINNGGQQIFQDIYPGWQTLAAETVNGDNQVLWKNVDWKLSASLAFG